MIIFGTTMKAILAFVVLLGVYVDISIAVTSDVGDCPSGWHFNPANQYCYYIDGNAELQYDEARDKCVADGGFLTSILSQDEQDFLNGLTSSTNKLFWIGLTDRAIEGTWVWEDGSQFVYNNWEAATTPSASNQDCVLFLDGAIYGQWNHEFCTDREGYICKQKPVPEPFCPFGIDPIGDTVLDKAVTDAEVSITLPSPFMFYGEDHGGDNLFISENGVISIYDSSDTPTATMAYLQTNFPTTTAPLIAPFWSDIDTSNEVGLVSYRVLETADKAANQDLFDKIDDIACQVRSDSGFVADWILVSTWHRVAFGSSAAGCDVVNSFQAVIARDNVQTYAIFHYNGIDWSSGTVDGGDPATGLGGKPAHVGFNKGDGSNSYYYFPEFFSGDDVITLDEGSNVNVNGRWAFEVDGANIGHPAGPSYNFVTDNYTRWEHDGSVEVCVVRSGGCISVAANIGLSIVSAGTTATTTSDFTPDLINIAFDADVTESCVEITIIDDIIVESLETLQLSIDPMEYGQAVALSSSTIYIKDNDVLNVFTLVQDRYDVNEGEGDLTVRILHNYPNIPGYLPGGSVVFRTILKSAIDPRDYAVSDKTIVFSRGQTEHLETIYFLDDAEVEDAEDLCVEIRDPIQGIIGDIPRANINIFDDDSTYSIALDRYEVLESKGPLPDVRVTRAGDLSQRGSVRFVKRNESAMEGEDYPAEVITLQFPPGVTSATEPIQITNDNRVERLEETFQIVLVAPENGRQAGITAANVTIIDDDSAFSFDGQFFDANEQDGVAPLIVTRDGNLNTIATVLVQLSADWSGKRKRRQAQASPGEDFESFTTIPVMFQSGESRREVEIPIIDDNIPERDEEVHVFLAISPDDVNNEIGEYGRAIIIIHDDELPSDTISFSDDVITAFEAEQQVVIPITRSGSNEESCIVRLSTRDVTNGAIATPSNDYGTAFNELVEFPSGITNINWVTQIVDDNDAEGVESFEVFLSDAFGCDIQGTGTARVDIYDNEATDGNAVFRLSRSQYEVNEDQGRVNVDVIRYGDVDDTGLVYIQTLNIGQATPIADYTHVSPTRIYFDPGQQKRSIPFTIFDDGTPEGSESFRVELLNPQGGRLDQNSAAIVFINDDDLDGALPMSIFNFKDASVEVVESGRVVRVEIVRGNYLLHTSAITVSSEPSTYNRATDSDYEEVSSRRIEFLPGMRSYTLEIPITDDSIYEPREAFRLKLSEPERGVLGNVPHTEVYIIDDDSLFALGNVEYEIYEDALTNPISVVRSGYTQRPASVRIQSAFLANGAEVDDFDEIYQTLNFPAGLAYLYVDVRIRNDADREADEAFELSLLLPVNGSLGDPSIAQVIIIDDDIRGPKPAKDSGYTTATIIGIVGGLAGVIVLIGIVVLVVCCFWFVARNARRPIIKHPPGVGHDDYGHRHRHPPIKYSNRAYEGY
ncbi:uncharacterized protein [Amphiura filiformis]|uniref:uncharacterized protein isoform X3 n=1 Tax=Amphiura filiformis TaxID=82378 RepID=UPI003B216159